MTIKKVIFGDEARKGLLTGMEKVAKTVGATAGAAGRNACIANQWGQPTMTKDGYKTSKSIELDGIEAEGAKLIKGAAEKQNLEAGDATTLVTTLTYEIAKEGMKYMEKGCNVSLLKKGIDIATADVVKTLTNMSKQITTSEEISQVATISANGDTSIGELIASATETVGKMGVITVEESKDIKTTLEISEGLQFDNGYLSPYFMTNTEKYLVEFDNPLILLSDYKINSLKQIVKLLEDVARMGRPLVIICDEIDNDALTGLVTNHIRGTIRCCVVKAPSFGDIRADEMTDMAILTNGKFVSEKLGNALEKITPECLGTCNKIKVYPNKTVIIGGAGGKETVDSRVSDLMAELNTTESAYDKSKLQERIAKLTTGIAVIKVGGSSEVEVNEKKDRVDDAVCSTKSALEEGILPGGGTSLVRAHQDLTNDTIKNKDILTGYEIVKQAILKQVVLLANNAGYSGEVVMNGILNQTDKNVGFDLITGEYVNMFDAGIIDATKCIRLAVETASSVAGSLLMTETVILPDIEKAIEMAKLTAGVPAQY